MKIEKNDKVSTGKTNSYHQGMLAAQQTYRKVRAVKSRAEAYCERQ